MSNPSFQFPVSRFQPKSPLVCCVPTLQVHQLFLALLFSLFSFFSHVSHNPIRYYTSRYVPHTRRSSQRSSPPTPTSLSLSNFFLLPRNDVRMAILSNHTPPPPSYGAPAPSPMLCYAILSHRISYPVSRLCLLTWLSIT